MQRVATAARRTPPDVLLRRAFDTLNLNRGQAETDRRKVASARVPEQLDLVRDGKTAPGTARSLTRGSTG